MAEQQWTPLSIDVEIGDGEWRQHTEGKAVTMGRIVRVGCLPAGTAEGRPTFEALIELEDGSVVVAETTWRLMNGAGRALRARWGDD